MKVQFAIQTAEDMSLPSSAERAVNWYAQQLPPNAKTNVEIIGTPGLTLNAGLGGDSIRAMHVWDGMNYAVSGTGLYRINTDGASTLLGTLPATGTVYLADNGTELGILVGASLYTWDGTTLAQVTDIDYPGASSFDVLDSYGVFTKPASREWFISDLRDLTAYDSGDVAQAESTPDDLVRVVGDRELWFFKTSSGEVWYNSGAADFPFSRVDGGRINVGLAAAKAVAKIDNTLGWLGDDKVVYRADGFRPQRISTHAIERLINTFPTVEDAFAFSYKEEGHAFLGITFPTGGATIVYDAATQLWHDRKTFGYDYWRPSSYVYLAGKHLWGDQLSGNIYESSLDVHTDAGLPIVRIAQSPPIKVAQDRVRGFLHRVEVDFEVGVGLTTGQGSDPQAMLQISRDGGKTFGNELWRTIGPIGNYRKRVVWNRLGTFRDTVVLKVAVSDPVKCVIAGAFAEIEGGTL